MVAIVTENTNAYLNTNVLHAKPISSRMFHGIQHLNIKIAHLDVSDGWKRKTVAIASKALTLTTYALSIQVALIEGVASTIFGLLGTLFQLAFTKKNDMIEKYSIKSMAYGLNSICTAGLAIASIAKSFSSNNDWAVPTKHSNISIFDGYTYLGSAATAQLFCTVMFNSIRGIKDNAPTLRSNQAIIEGTPAIFSQITHSMRQEYEFVNCEADFDPMNYAQDYITSYPPALDDRDWANNFDLGEFLSDHVFKPLSELVEQFSDQYNFIESDNVLERRDAEYVMNPLSENEKRYHDVLKTYVKEAVKRLIQNEWAKYIEVDNDFENGKERLGYFDASWTIPLANIAQLVELENPLSCPAEFSQSDLAEHNNRRDKLIELKSLLDSISDNDKELLIERLIKTSMFELGPRHYDQQETVDTLYRGVYNLGGALHQSRLLTLPTINVETYEGGGENYFGRCWGDAFAEFDED